MSRFLQCLVILFSLVACSPNEVDFPAHRKVVCVGNKSLVVSPLGTVYLQTGGVWKAYLHLVETALDLSASSLAASSGYWLYAYDDHGALGFKISTTEPDEGLRYMRGDNGHWFVSYLSTDTLGNVVKYTQSDFTFRFAPSGPTVLNGGSARVITPITISPYVPRQALSFRYVAYINATCQGRYADVIDVSGLDPVRLLDNRIVQHDRREDFQLTPIPALGYKGVPSYAVSDSATQMSMDLLGFDL